MVIRQYRMFKDLLNNQHQYAAAVLAKISVTWATVIWSLVVLARDDALATWPGHSIIDVTGGENTWAAVLLVTSTLSFIRIWMRSAPRAIGVMTYGMFCIFWLYVWFSLMISYYLEIAIARPGQAAAISVITALSIFAFVSNPKRMGDAQLV